VIQATPGEPGVGSETSRRSIAHQGIDIMLQKLIGLAVAGAAGTLARYSLAGIVHRWLGGMFPWGTAVVNILGCFLFGLVWTAAGERTAISPELRSVVLISFMGAFTTFSTFVSESGQLLSDAEVLVGFANVAFQLVTGLGVFYLGLAVGRTI
jgi:CrcB protein